MAEVAVKPQRHQPSEYTVGMTALCSEVIPRRGILPESGRTFRKKGCFPTVENFLTRRTKFWDEPSFGTNQVLRTPKDVIVKEGTERWPSARRDDEMRRRREV